MTHSDESELPNSQLRARYALKSTEEPSRHSVRIGRFNTHVTSKARRTRSNVSKFAKSGKAARLCVPGVEGHFKIETFEVAFR